MRAMAKLLRFWLPPIVWALFIFFFSTLPTIETTEIYWQDFIVKKLAHMIEYGILAVLLYRALVGSGHSKKNAGLLAILIALVYGATDEYHQSFTPGREPKVRDVVFDTAGAILAIYITWNFLPKAPKKLKVWAAKFDLL